MLPFMTLPTIRELLETRRQPLLSLEFYPPKDSLSFGIFGSSIERMRPARPDFVTCTYGAGGASREFSFTAWELLARMGFTPVVAHLTCIGASRDELAAQIDRIHATGIRNIMALRGDPPRGVTEFIPAPDGLAHAADLVALIKSRHPDICCGVAGYPETHPEATTLAADIRHLREKVDAGADFITTQLFFENPVFFSFRDECRAAGIRVPILPGLLPAVSLSQARRTIALCKAAFPRKLEQQLEAAGADAEAARRIGIDWLIAQIDGLIAGETPGIHLYILNQARTILDPHLTDCLARWRTLPLHPVT